MRFQELKIYNTNILDLALYLFVFSLPFKLILTPIAFGLLVLFSTLFIEKGKAVKNLKDYSPILLLSTFYLLNFLGFIFAPNQGSLFKKIDTQLLLFFIPLVFCFLPLKVKQLCSLKRVFIIAMTCFCICAFLSLAYNLIVNFEHKGDYNFIQRSMYHFHYPYDVLYVNCAYIFLLFSYASTFSNYKRIIIAFFFFIFITLSGVRLGIFCFLLISLVYFVVNFKKLFSVKLILTITFFLFLGLISIKTSRYANDKFFDTLSKFGFGTEKYVSDIGEEYHKISLREKLWSSARKAYVDNKNKFLGYGPHGSRKVLDDIYLKQEFFDIQGMNSHNQYLTTLLNKGILGLFFLLSIFLLALHKSYKSKSLENFLLVTLTMIAFFTESMLERQKGVVFFALFMSFVFFDNKLRLQPKLKQ